MIAYKAEEKERRRVARFGYISKREDFVACFSCYNMGDAWFEHAWPTYQAKVAFIQAAYSDRATSERLYADRWPPRRRSPPSPGWPRDAGGDGIARCGMAHFHWRGYSAIILKLAGGCKDACMSLGDLSARNGGHTRKRGGGCAYGTH